MKERYLHYLWEHKLIPLDGYMLLNGKSIHIMHPGEYNQSESGPDFFNAQVIIDSITWVGNIEIHVNSSDWFRHGHQNDKAYENVILHVVMNHDLPISNPLSEIATMELKNWIDSDHYQWFNLHYKKKGGGVLCRNQIIDFQPIQAVFMMERALLSRLYRKTIDLNKHIEDPKQALFELLAAGMGTKVNQLPFIELVQKISLNELKSKDKQNQKNSIIRVSGLTTNNCIQDSIECVSHVNLSSWKKKGLRSTAFPQVRIMQFSTIVSEFDFNYQFIYSSPEEILNYCKTLLINCRHKMFEIGVHGISQQLINGLIINSFVPFIFWYGQLKNDELIYEKAFQLLRLLPFESNSIISKWKNLQMPNKNAADSQALLEIYNQFCFRKKCLDCEIGKMILGR